MIDLAGIERGIIPGSGTVKFKATAVVFRVSAEISNQVRVFRQFLLFIVLDIAQGYKATSAFPLELEGSRLLRILRAQRLRTRGAR